MTEQTLDAREDEQLVDLHAHAALREVTVREGVMLRPLDETDAPALLRILDADSSIRDRVTVASRMHSIDDVKREIESYKGDDSVIRYAICEDGKTVGLVSFWRDTGFFCQVADPHKFGFGYFLDRAERGKGLVTDSVRALMASAQSSFRVDSFIAFCEDSNKESVSVLQKLGMEPTGLTYPEPTHGWAERMYEKRTING